MQAVRETNFMVGLRIRRQVSQYVGTAGLNIQGYVSILQYFLNYTKNSQTARDSFDGYLIYENNGVIYSSFSCHKLTMTTWTINKNISTI